MRIAMLCALALALLGGFSGAVLAEPGASLAIKGGVNWATLQIDPDDAADLESWMRPGGGICISLPLDPKIWLDIDVLYLQKGALQVHDEMLELNDTEWRLNYAVVAPMLRLVPGGMATGPYLIGGAEIGYLVDWEIVYDDGSGGEESYSEDDVFEDLDYSVTVGAGLQFVGSGSASFFLEGRYTLGMQNISSPREDAQRIDQQVEIKTQGIYALAGIRF
ncbi:MAG: outer membrane beta-barrel protein [Candidatus Eisenbacteria bacterium]|nr:outer membrane beta-barrel protein [Candidatus Eisenbacteria bacterium]